MSLPWHSTGFPIYNGGSMTCEPRKEKGVIIVYNWKELCKRIPLAVENAREQVKEKMEETKAEYGLVSIHWNSDDDNDVVDFCNRHDILFDEKGNIVSIWM